MDARSLHITFNHKLGAVVWDVHGEHEYVLVGDGLSIDSAPHGGLLFSSPYLLAVGLLTVGGLFVVGKVYWFSAPFIGIGISLACYVASVIVALV